MRVAFRADASIQIGSGHIMRCLTLAEELHDRGVSIEFVVRNHKGNLNHQIQSKGFVVQCLPDLNLTHLQQKLSKYEQLLGVEQLTDADETIQIFKERILDWLIIDHYALDYNWEKKLRPYAKKIMVIDDLSNRRHDCDLLLDQNYIHNEKRYDDLLAPNTIKLLGIKYTLLRKDFFKNRKNHAMRGDSIERVFVFFGGTDPDNLTIVAINVLLQPKLKHLLVDVVIGSGNPHRTELELKIRKYSNVKLHVQVDNISELMASADVALGAGGSATWERMAIGLPSIIITVSDNQIELIKDLDQDGCLKWLGNLNQGNEQMIYCALLDIIKNPKKLIEQSCSCQKLIDGKGAGIVAQLLLTGPSIEALTIRKATKSDLMLYWNWANELEVRENAFSQEFIELENHKKWFNKKLNSNDSILILIGSEFGAIGQVRFDRSDSCYTIDYSLARQYRSFGLGKKILSMAIDYLKCEESFTLIGKVKVNNQPSIKVFKSLGFRQLKSISHKESRIFQKDVLV